MKTDKFKIVDKDGIEMPDKHNGERRNKAEAQKIVDLLNKNGESKPYRMINIMV